MAATEVLLVTGERLRVDGLPEAVQAIVVGAARGSLMDLAWLTDIDRGQPVGVNPEHVVALRSVDGGPSAGT